MNKYDAWLKINNSARALEDVLQIIHNRGFAVNALRLNRSLDKSSYHINMEIEGSSSPEGLSRQMAVLCHVSKVEIDNISEQKDRL